jgi:hypothetical protein
MTSPPSPPTAGHERGDAETSVQRAALRVVLREVRFPASVWQLLAHAQRHGAPAGVIVQLSRLPRSVYGDAWAVLAEVDDPDPAPAQAGPSGPRRVPVRDVRTVTVAQGLL